MAEGDGAEPRPRRVLVVEDDPGVRQVFVTVLQGEGYDTVAVADAASMRQALAAGDIDAAIIDVVLPGAESGLALAREAADCGCGVILVTGQHDRYAAVAASGYQHLFKPFRIGALLLLLKRMLEPPEARRGAADRTGGN